MYYIFHRQPLLGIGSEFRSNSVSGGRPSAFMNKTSVNSMGIGGLGNSNSFAGNNSNKTSDKSNRSSGNSGESGVTDR